jgi:hypothetical protein
MTESGDEVVALGVVTAGSLRRNQTSKGETVTSPVLRKCEMSLKKLPSSSGLQLRIICDCI